MRFNSYVSPSPLGKLLIAGVFAEHATKPWPYAYELMVKVPLSGEVGSVATGTKEV